MEKLTQKNIDRAWRIELKSSDECGTNTSGALLKKWVFDTTLFYGDVVSFKLPAFCDEITARYELAKYLEKHA